MKRNGMLKQWGFAFCAGLLAISAGAAMGVTTAVAGEDEELWQSIRDDVFQAGKPIVDNSDKLVLDAPYRAEDAAVVPITITLPADVAPHVRKLTLIVEKNPAPVVATFKFGEAAGLGERRISTRIRVDMYSNVRAVAELDDGSLQMQTKFVKAAGGCSAPALKDMDAALANIGKMKIKSFGDKDASSTLTSEAQIMVRHPNYSGMQMNQLTGLYIPAKYVDHIEVKKGNALVFDMEGGISLSENPNIRFTYSAAVDGPLSVVARDTDGKTFTGSVAVSGS